MSKTHWIVLALVATMVCNGNCRPRELEHKNIYPVYRSEKQLETSNRYDKDQPNGDSVTYHRIDIPHQRVNKITHKNTLIDYVPVALTVKRPNVKVWPSDQNGIESTDDLSLYNTYTNNINPLNYLTPVEVSHSKPSILIVEEITHKPFYDYDNVYTQPIQVLDKPPPQTYPTYVEIPQPYPTPSYTVENQYPLILHNETQTSLTVPHQTEIPVHTQQQTHPPIITYPTQQTPTTSKPEITTKKKKPIKCPNVSITATTLINNSNKMKEGCQDINIHISTNINNSNTAIMKPNTPTNSSVVVVQNDPQIGMFGIFDIICSTPSVEVENVSRTNQKLNIESIATVARASSDGSPLPSPTALGHMLDTVSQLVESDIRTPPKLKEIIKEKANEHRKEVLGENSTPLPYTFVYDDDIGRFEEKHETTDKTLLVDSSEGKASSINTDQGVKGIAIPVVMDEDYEMTAPSKKLQKIPEVAKPAKDDKKKIAMNKSQSTTTPSSGLSTWILLSDNKDVTTPSPKKNNKKDDDKKKGGATTTKKPTKVQPTTQKTTTKKVTTKTKPETEISALEALVKNQKKGSTTTSKPKPTEPKKKYPERLEVAETKNKLETELQETKTIPPQLVVATTKDKAVTATVSQTVKTTTENSVEGTTKKKSTTKKKKKNKNRRKKPADDTGVEAKIPAQPMGSQIYNFLSREIVPTVGLGLIGVALTAGLASFLGYNPFGGSTVPLRRTYDTNHGYSPNNYYNYNTDYGGGGQSEEVLFREVLSGMPEDSRYGLTHTDITYPEAYNRQDQYDTVKNSVYPTATGSMYSDKDMGSYDANYSQDYSTGYGTTYENQDKKEKYPVYTRETGTSFVYPETTGMTSADKIGDINSGEKYTKKNPDTIERQPEALYRVASESDLQYRNGESTIQGVSSQNSWHRIGSPMEAKKHYPVVEPGPRSLDVSKESAKEVKKRSKRAAESVIQRISRKRTKKESDVENEIDFDDFNDSKFSEVDDFPTTTAGMKTTTLYTETTTASDTQTTTSKTTTEEVKEVNPTETYDTDSDVTVPPSSGVSVLDVLKRLAQFKLRLGLNFLRSTTDLFSRYLDDIQKRVDESFANTTTTTVQYNRRKSPWSRIFFSRLNDDDDDKSHRRKRSVLDDNQYLGAMLTAEQDVDDRYSKSTKKDLRLTNKIFHQKKNAPKKFESKRTN